MPTHAWYNVLPKVEKRTLYVDLVRRAIFRRVILCSGGGTHMADYTILRFATYGIIANMATKYIY